MLTKLQIISGKYKGKKLIIPDGARPTQGRARGAVFNILSSIFLDKDAARPLPKSFTVWDAFAGSGAMGIEFISRFGAGSAIFTDATPVAIKAIKGNTKNIDGCKITVEKTDALKFPIPNATTVSDATVSANTEGFLIVFIDPPYSAPELGQQLVERLGDSKEVPSETIVVWEFEKDSKSKTKDFESGVKGFKLKTKKFKFEVKNSQFEIPKDFEIIKDKTYGRAQFLVLRKI